MDKTSVLLISGNPAEKMSSICEALDLENVAYFGLPSFGSLQTPPRLQVTYKSSWVENYKSSKYAAVDPVLQHGIRSSGAFNWDELDKNAPNTRTFFEDAADFGVGCRGYTVPIHGRGRPIGLVSFTSNQRAECWRKCLEENETLFQLLSLSLHEDVWRYECDTNTGQKLTDRESECLKWAAIGKTAYETSIIINISERTVRHHLEMCRNKLDATNITHAVVKAINSNILNVNF